MMWAIREYLFLALVDRLVAAVGRSIPDTPESLYDERGWEVSRDEC